MNEAFPDGSRGRVGWVGCPQHLPGDGHHVVPLPDHPHHGAGLDVLQQAGVEGPLLQTANISSFPDRSVETFSSA